MTNDQSAEQQLLETGIVVPVTLLDEVVIPGADGGEFSVRLEVSFEDEDSPPDDRADIVEWGAFGFLYTIAVLSFADARPRGASEIDYVDADEFRVSDLLAGLSFVSFRQGCMNSAAVADSGSWR